MKKPAEPVAIDIAAAQSGMFTRNKLEIKSLDFQAAFSGTLSH